MPGKINSQRPMLKPSFINFFKFSLIAVVVLAVVFIGMAFMQNDSIDYSKSDFIQLKEPDDDEDVVVFETTEGTFKAVLYEDEAPEYVKYFKKLVKDKYFDDTYICTIVKNQEGLEAGFLGGSKSADGTTTKESNTELTDIEISPNLLPIKGALGSLCTEKGMFTSAKAGSIITFVNDVVNPKELKDSVKDGENVNGRDEVTDIFLEVGGVPNLMQQYTLFGQVFDGWETYDKISAYEIIDENKADDAENKSYQPINDIKITKAYLSTYKEEKTGEYKLPEKAESNSEQTSTGEAATNPGVTEVTISD